MGDRRVNKNWLEKKGGDIWSLHVPRDPRQLGINSYQRVRLFCQMIIVFGRDGVCVRASVSTVVAVYITATYFTLQSKRLEGTSQSLRKKP